MYSCNNNQNYFIQDNRSTSRVLQPPGGASSFSIGGYGGACDDNISRKRAGNQNKPSSLQAFHDSNKSATTNHGRRDSLDNNKSSTTNYGRRDSLDDIVEKSCNIPGLENHYKGTKLSSYASHKNDSRCDDNEEYFNKPANLVVETRISRQDSGNRRSNGPLGAQEYASLLKAQIEDTKRMKQEDEENHYANRKSLVRMTQNEKERNGFPKNWDKPSKAAANNSGKGKTAAVPSIKVHAPPGGQSSFSLGWM